MLCLDIAFYSFATTLVSITTILPTYIRHLTTSNLAIGALSALATAGFALPNLFFAPIAERVVSKKRLILWVTPGERIPYLILAVVAATLAVSHPGTALLLTFLLISIFAGTGGALTPAWLDLIARAIPVRRRGAFFGRSNALAGLMGIGGALLSQRLLDAGGFPDGYVHLFLIAFVPVMVSYGFFALNREQGPLRQKSREPVTQWVRRLPGIVARDRNFSWYLLAAMAGSLANAASGFFMVVAIGRLGIGDREAGWYTAVLLTAQTAINLLWGHLADRRGHKVVLIGGAVAIELAIPAALLLPNAASYALVFALLGAAASANALSRFAIMLEFAPEDRRPTYVGLASVAGAPMALTGPLLGGWLADHAGFPAAFAVFWVAGLVALWILARRVREPRPRIDLDHVEMGATSNAAV